MRWSTLITATVTATALAACADYEFRVNERVVYTPLPLFSDFTIPDGALSDCVTQTIADQNVVRAPDLVNLNCSHAGIGDLSGLETFFALVSLRLDHNALGELSALASLTNLQALDLSANELRDVSTLVHLPELRELNLRENPQLDCATLPQHNGRHGPKITPPEHCESQ